MMRTLQVSGHGMFAHASAQRGQYSSLRGVIAQRKCKLPPTCSDCEANGKGPLCMGRVELCRAC